MTALSPTDIFLILPKDHAPLYEFVTRGDGKLARLAVAMSGGVDSSVAALFLKQEGHQIVGLSLRLGAGPDRAWRAGAAAAAQLGLEHADS